MVRESQFSGAGQTGATYMFESWYLARQDINIYNSMGTVNAMFTRNSTTWSVGGNNQYKLGPAIDRWVDPAAPGANARSVEVVTPEGRIKVAVKATDLGNGRWRYDYAAMNLDFARTQTVGSEPNIRLLKSLGFDNIRIPVGTATVTDLVFSDGDTNAGNDWVASIQDGRLTWSAISRTNALNWGTMFRFSFIVNQAPVPSAITLHIAAPDARDNLLATGLLAPAALGGKVASSAAAAVTR